MSALSLLGSLRNHLQYSFENIDANKAEADKYNVELFAYEGGQHLATTKYQNNDKLIELMIEANRHTEMKDIYVEYYDYWYENGGNLFAAFELCNKASKSGAWGILEHFDQLENNVSKWQLEIIQFDASGLSSGVYVYSLETEGISSFKKMILIK